jgi:predicted DNA-binding antitoxin AbrB/MazE fold protein
MGPLKPGTSLRVPGSKLTVAAPLVAEFAAPSVRHYNLVKERLMKTIHAIYAGGVFRPIEAVDLAENCEVEFEPRPVSKELKASQRRKVSEILSQSFDTSEPDLAARHDEHQPIQ